jgi:hypothetical protein
MATSNKAHIPPLARRMWETGFPVAVLLIAFMPFGTARHGA